jgi:hypothetical protein
VKKKCRVIPLEQNEGQSNSIKIGYKSFKRVEEFEYLGSTLTYQNFTHEEIKSGLKARNACYQSVQNFLSSSLLSKRI